MEATNKNEGEKLLIYSNEQEISRTTQEAQSRADILNKLSSYGLSDDEIRTLTSSTGAIEREIFNRQLSQNKELKKLYDSGIEVEAKLPKNLEEMKYALMAWHSYPMSYRNGSKFENLIYISAWGIDADALERYFIRQQYKFFIRGEQVVEYKEILQMCEYFEKHKAESGQIKSSSFLWDRIESYGQHKYRPRWTYFRNN